MDDCCDDGMVNAKACCGDSEQDTTAIAAAMHAFILVAIVLFDGCGVVWMDNKYYVLQLQQDGAVYFGACGDHLWYQKMGQISCTWASTISARIHNKFLRRCTSHKKMFRHF